jgi:hypothetical protein
VTATAGEDGDLRSLKIRLASDPWFADSASIEQADNQDSGIYLSDIVHLGLEGAIGDDLEALSAAGAEWTDIGSVHVAGELYISHGAASSRIAAILAGVFRRVDIGALVGEAVRPKTRPNQKTKKWKTAFVHTAR